MYPALAVVAELGPEADVLWIGVEGGRADSLLVSGDMKLETIPAAGLHGVGLRALPGNLLRLVRGYFASRRILNSFQPDVLFFTGGYLGVPVALAGWARKKLAFVPDIEPGLALRLVGRLADRIAVTAPDSLRYYRQSGKVVVTGYPVRRTLGMYTREEAAQKLGVDPSRPILLAYGGSLGARSINEAIWSALTELLAEMQIVHITGLRDWPRVEAIRSKIEPATAGDYHPFEYLHAEMGAALSAADLAVSRAGASTLGEFAAYGLPSVLVPYPHAWRYQSVNADYLAERGASVRVEDAHLERDLLATVRALMSDSEKLTAMRQAARSLAVPNAAAAIAAEIRRLASEGGGQVG